MQTMTVNETSGGVRKMDRAYIQKKKSDVHITPDRVYELIEKEWGYKKHQMFDPCPVNPKWNGLDIAWRKVNIVNPPYEELPEFVAKAYLEKLRGKKTIMLLPSKTEQAWFHDFILYHGYEPKWIRRRLKFKNNKWQSPQPHFLVMIE